MISALIAINNTITFTRSNIVNKLEYPAPIPVSDIASITNIKNINIAVQIKTIILRLEYSDTFFKAYIIKTTITRKLTYIASRYGFLNACIPVSETPTKPIKSNKL